MSSYKDPWESKPEYPPAPLDEAPGEDAGETPEIAAKHRRLKWLSIMSGGLAAAVIISPALYESAEAIVKRHAGPSAAEIKKRQDDARTLFVLGAIVRAKDNKFGYCAAQESLAPRKYRKQDVLDYNNMLRGELGEAPLKENKLLDYAAQHTAQRLADNPALFDNFKNVPLPQSSRLQLEGMATGKWSAIRIEALQIPSGQTAFELGCHIDSPDGSSDIKSAAYIGAGSVLSKINHQRYLVLEYGVKTA